MEGIDMRASPRLKRTHPEGTVHDDDTITWCNRRVRFVPKDIWEKGPGLRFMLLFIGMGAEAQGITKGASRLRWGCEPGETSPPGYDPVAAAAARSAAMVQ